MIEYVKFVNRNNGREITLNDEFYPLYRFETPVDVRNQDIDKMQDHGQWPTYTYLGKRLIRCEGDIFGKDSDDYIFKRRALIKALIPQGGDRTIGDLTLRFSGMPEDVRAECTIDGMPEIPIEALSPSRTSFQVTFKCFDPILYGKTKNVAMSEFSDLAPGRAYDKSYDKTYATGGAISGVSGLVSVVNTGDVEIFPIVKVYGPCTSPELQLLVDEFTYFLGFSGLVLSDTDVLTVDFKAKVANSVEKGDVYSYATGTWWTLKPGENFARFYAFVAGSGAKAEFSWFNGYML
jgi:hypothetical protein